MKGYILDSDTWIEYFRHCGGVDKHIAETPADEIFASEVSIAELTYGVLHSKAVEKHLQEPKKSQIHLLYYLLATGRMTMLRYDKLSPVKVSLLAILTS